MKKLKIRNKSDVLEIETSGNAKNSKSVVINICYTDLPNKPTTGIYLTNRQASRLKNWLTLLLR